MNILHRIVHRADLGYIGFGNLNAEGFLEGDDQLDRIKTVGAKVIDQRRLRGNHKRIDAKMAADDTDNSCGNVVQLSASWAGAAAAPATRAVLQRVYAAPQVSST